MTDQTEKKVKLAAEDGRSPHPRSLETLGGLVLQYEDELLRYHDELAKRVREFRTDLNSRFKDIAYDVYAAPDRRWIQYILRDLGWHVYIDVKRDEFWGYRFGEEEPACFRHTASLLLEDIERIKKTKDDDEAYGVLRSPFWGKIAKTVHDKIGPQRRLRLRRKNDKADKKEDDGIVFTLDGKFTFEAHEDGTFSCPGRTNSLLDDVLAHLQDPGKQAIRAKIQHWKEEKAKQDQERSAWDAVSKAAIGLSKALAVLDQPEWGPDTNTRSFYFALNTLYRFAKTKADDPPVNLEQAVVNECLKEMVNLPTPEIVKKLELVSQLVKEEEEQ